MSLDASAWALNRAATQTTQQFAVLAFLADCHNGHTGLCFPSVPTICARTHMSRASVYRVINQLSKIGLLERGKLRIRLNRSPKKENPANP